MDDEILKTVESMLGKNVKIVDCEKISSVREEEILLINGIPITLDGDDGIAIKTALMTGEVPPCDLLNQLLFRAGILRQPVHLETSLSVKTTLVTKEEVTVARDGRILDERSTETKEDNFYTSSCKEVWEPIKMIPTAAVPSIQQTATDPRPVIFTSSPTSSSTINAAPPLLAQSSTASSSSSRPPSFNASSSLVSCSSVSSDLSPSASSVSLSQPTSRSSSRSAAHLNRTYEHQFATQCQIQPTNVADSAHVSRKSNRGSAASFPDNHYCNANHNNHSYMQSISCDSGHDDRFNNSSCDQSNNLIHTPNSMSSCYELSTDEIDFVVADGPDSPRMPASFPITGKPIAITPMAKPSRPVYVTARPQQALPTIFGTVAEQSPKDTQSRRSLPQTSINPSKSGPTITHNSHGTIDHSAGHINDPDDNALVYQDGNLISGSLSALLQHMVPTGDYYPDKSYLFAFLLSARLFIRPHELLERICHLCDMQQQLDGVIERTGARHLSYQSSQQLSQQQQQQQQSHHQHHHQHSSAAAAASDDATGSSPAAAATTTITTESPPNVTKFAAHFVQLLSEWIETFPYDFRDERLMQHVRSMTHKCIQIDANLRAFVSTMLQNLLHRLTVLDQYEVCLGRINAFIESTGGGGGGGSSSTATGVGGLCTIGGDDRLTTSSSTSSSGITIQSASVSSVGGGGGGSGCSGSGGSQSISNQSAGDITELCPNPTQLSHQLTHIELERLSHIGPEEFVQAFAKENPQLETSFNDMKKTRNLESYIQWFNRLSYLVATEIVKHSKKKQRVRVVEYWIETARECFNIGNFNSLMAIIAGLNMSPISRLKKTWAKVQSAKFMVLEHQMDPTSNFNSYRSTLKAAMWRSAGATDERQRIVIPFFSLLVKDLYFLNEGCSNRLPNGHINFDKFWQLAKQVTEFIAWKQVTCTFDKLPKVTMFLQTNQVLNENTLAMASFECEPPENNQEKDRYKALKSEYLNGFHASGEK